MRHFKIRLRLKGSQRELWIAVRAKSVGEAIVIADNRCLERPFQVCGGIESFIQISEGEYHSILDSATSHGKL
ncbi:hypothetical protein SAMN04487941_3989 [Pontibacter akesuensis]|uniref:Uncharacterized protein n=1 Tax=Pontibacter akesuensis TaxID=388950 RepID=A0A1I7KQK2_9BACT|nr:hypothetical protein SAMN04487941_3989 [Pontibacter akesuensis]